MSERKHIERLSAKYEPESEREIYWFNKCEGIKAEIRHLKIEAGKDKAYIHELEDKLKAYSDENLRIKIKRQASEITRLQEMNKELKSQLNALI